MKTPRYFDRTEDAAKHVGLSVHAFRRLYTKGKKGPRRIQEGWRFHYAIADLDVLVKTLVERLQADKPTVKLRLDTVAFPSGRELAAFCDHLGEDFGRVTWTQD
jgi:hypothetical protein